MEYFFYTLLILIATAYGVERDAALAATANNAAEYN